jgi:peptidoglycan/xylan/chitin deacetylase (PgdA/CDA1 family)
MNRRRFIKYGALTISAILVEKLCLQKPIDGLRANTEHIYLPLIVNGQLDTQTLPQNLLTASGTLWEDFETAGDWTPAAGTVVASTSEFKTGVMSMKLTSNPGVAASMTRTVNWDMSGDWQQLRFWMYLHNTTLSDYATNNTIMVKLYTNAFSDWYQAWWQQSFMHHSGWNLFTVPKNYFKVGGGSPSWANPIVRLRFGVTATSGKVAEVSFDDFEVGYTAIPAVMLRFDDGNATQYIEAFSYMKQSNIRGTLYQIGSWIDVKPYITSSQLIEMQAAGWTIGNHTHAHSDLPTLSEADQEIAIASGKADLDALGLTGGRYVGYPQGHWNANTRTAMTHLGILTGASVQGSTAQTGTPYPPIVLPSSDLFNIGCTDINSSVPLSTAKAYIDEAIKAGTVISPLFHSIGIGGTSWTVADFRSFIDYIASKRTQIIPITIDDLYKLTLGQVNVPL